MLREYTATDGTPTRLKTSDAAASAWARAPQLVLSGLNIHTDPSGAVCSDFVCAPPRWAALAAPKAQDATADAGGRAGRSATTAWWAFRDSTICRCFAAKDFGLWGVAGAAVGVGVGVAVGTGAGAGAAGMGAAVAEDVAVAGFAVAGFGAALAVT